ncbi:MAG: hypothetical protein KGJ89_05345 [Patescibacteria group bacterium]|nr:hypothetical protein [Patescibacteria group bacterium]MDE2015858.1 hypothetical protein [Patescibacteria group bacterium]MDE2227347.1 hypothetical protein [Patescibacteria group bacterium]
MAESDFHVPMQGSFHDAHTPPLVAEEGLESELLDPLSLDIPDDELIDIIDTRIQETRNFYKNTMDLYNRRLTNEVYYFGKQIIEKEKAHLLKDYESRYKDNAIFEIEATLKPLAMSRLPDLLVTPGNDSQDAKLMSQELSKAIDTQVKNRENRLVLGLAFKHRPVYFAGVIKAVWDPEIDDYRFLCIHPDMIDVDCYAPTNNADDMEIVSQIIPITIKEVFMRFPKAKDKFIAELQTKGININPDKPWENEATKIKIRETWFTWYKKAKEKDEYERVEGVMWKYEKCLLKKMKNPNFDYEGEDRYFTYVEGKKQELTVDQEMQIIALGVMPPDVQTEKVYHNYFRRPRKPFYFMGYDQWGKQPLDETSELEQNIHLERALDKRGKQIEETLDNRGHHVWSKESGLKSGDVQGMDMNDPDVDVIVDGDVNKVHKYIEPARPTPDEFSDMESIRNRMYGIAGANAVRGQIQTQVATTNQIAREADFTRADDLVEDTINGAAEWMGDWALQFIKLRYTKDHFREILGVAGDIVYVKLNRNMVRDGMIIKIKASGTDKLKAQNNAIDMAKLKMIDPVQFFRDMGLPDPEGRAKQLMMWMSDPNTYMMQYVLGLETSEDMANKLIQDSATGGAGAPPAPPAPPAPAPMAPPAPPAPSPGLMGAPVAPTPTNTAAVPAMPPAGAPVGSPRGL